MPDLTQMETLVLVTELGSLAAAARQLQISAAAVSKQLTRLEEELGLQLMIRSTRHLELTDAGMNYCAQCRRILEEVEAASALVSNIKALPHGKLKVVSARHFGAAYIVPHLKEFLSLYPKIELELELAERHPDVNAEAIDVLIGLSLSATGDVIQKRITSTFYTYCAAPAYISQFGLPTKVSDLKHHRYISHSMRKPDDELSFRHHESIKLQPYIRVNDTETMLRLALEGLGIVKLHHYVVKKQLEEGFLQAIPLPDSDLEIPLYVAYPQRRYIASKIRHFIDFTVAKINQSDSKL